MILPRACRQRAARRNSRRIRVWRLAERFVKEEMEARQTEHVNRRHYSRGPGSSVIGLNPFIPKFQDLKARVPKSSPAGCQLQMQYRWPKFAGFGQKSCAVCTCLQSQLRTSIAYCVGVSISGCGNFIDVIYYGRVQF